MEKYMFWKTTQTHDKTIDSFVTSLRHRAKSCEFGTQEESLIRDRLVLGCLDQRLQKRLLRETDLTLEKAINLYCIAETTKEQLKTLQMETNFNVCVLTSAKRNINIKSCSHCGAKHAPCSCPA